MQSLGFITATDARKITPEDALRFERIHQRTYLAFDYQIIPIAAGPLPEPERIALSIRSSPSRFHLTPIESMSRLLDDPFLAEGIRLFNQGELFAAHEVWEKIWLAAEGDDRLFCQALIQVAVALLHAQRGNLRGAFSVYAKARHKLNRFPAVWAQIELGEFRSALAACFAALKAGRMLDQLPKIARKSLIA